MKKIGLVLFQPPGYSETFFNSKIKGLQECGYSVTLFTDPCSKTYAFCDHKKSPKVNRFFLLQVFHMFLIGLQLLPHFKTVLKFMRLEREEGSSIKRILEKVYLNFHLLKFKGDWLHFGFATLSIGRELLAKAIDIKMAVSFRGYDINVYPLKHPNCYNLLWMRVDKVHAISQYLLNRASLLGMPKNIPSQVITPAVDLRALPGRAAHDVGSALKIVTIARLNWIKGIDYLIEVAHSLQKAHVNFEWLIIGSGQNAEIERYLYHLHEKGLQNQVILKGACSHSETLNILASADIYVQTSLNEGFCNAVLEAQALGIPCVAFDVGGLSENIADKTTGWLIEPYNVFAMANTIIDISNFEVNQHEALAELAVERVHRNFSLIQQSAAFHQFYK